MATLEIISRALLFSALLLGTPAALLLAVVAETGRGSAAGYLALGWVATGVLAVAGWARAAVVGLVTSACGVAVLLFTVPPAEAPDGLIHSTPIPFRLSQVVPEIDQVKVGLALAPRVDRFIDPLQARRVARLVLPTYRSLGTEHRRSALAFGYDQFFGGNEGTVHMYWTSTSTRTGGPALIFLHGSAGNFLAYPALLSRLDVPVVCPTSGFGLYLDRAATADTVARARRFAVETLGADPDRVFLAALSQGGYGATQVAHGDPSLRGVVLISAVVDEAAMAAWSGPDVLLLHGVMDRRISKSYAEAAVAALSTSTASVSARYWPTEDHFLLYAQPTEVVDAIRSWMAARD